MKKYFVLSDLQSIDCDFRDQITSAYDPNTIALNIIPRFQCVHGSYLEEHFQENGGYPAEWHSVLPLTGDTMPPCKHCSEHCNPSGTVCEYPCDQENPILTCDEFTAKCECVNERIVGQNCDQCKPEYWQNFPDCSEGILQSLMAFKYRIIS